MFVKDIENTELKAYLENPGDAPLILSGAGNGVMDIVIAQKIDERFSKLLYGWTRPDESRSSSLGSASIEISSGMSIAGILDKQDGVVYDMPPDMTMLAAPQRGFSLDAHSLHETYDAFIDQVMSRLTDRLIADALEDDIQQDDFLSAHEAALVEADIVEFMTDDGMSKDDAFKEAVKAANRFTFRSAAREAGASVSSDTLNVLDYLRDPVAKAEQVADDAWDILNDSDDGTQLCLARAGVHGIAAIAEKAATRPDLELVGLARIRSAMLDALDAGTFNTFRSNPTVTFERAGRVSSCKMPLSDLLTVKSRPGMSRLVGANLTSSRAGYDFRENIGLASPYPDSLGGFGVRYRTDLIGARDILNITYRGHTLYKRAADLDHQWRDIDVDLFSPEGKFVRSYVLGVEDRDNENGVPATGEVVVNGLMRCNAELENGSVAITSEGDVFRTHNWGVSQIQGMSLEDWMKEELESIAQVQDAPAVDLGDDGPGLEQRLDVSR